MKRRLTALIEDLERSSLPWWSWPVTFLALVAARNLLEGALGPKGAIGFVYFSGPSALMVLDHFALFYASLFLGIAVILTRLSGERIDRVMKVMTPAWILVLLPPVLDHVISGGEGVDISYVLNLRPVLMRFFDPRAALAEISVGQRVEILLACHLAMIYVKIKTRGWWRALVAFPAVYLLMAILGAFPAAFARLWMTVTRGVVASAEFAYHLAFRAGGIVPDESRKLALLFMFATAVLGWYAFRLYAPDKARAMFRNVRPLRSMHYIGMAGFGAAFGWALFSRSGVQFAGAGDFLGVASVCAAAFLAFQASVSVNDIFDEEGDRITEPTRPLVTGALTKGDLVARAAVLSGAALLFAINIKYSTFLFMLLALAVSFFYSAPPIRLKRFPVVSSLALGLISLLTCLMGFSLFAEERAMALFPSELGWIIVLAFGLGFAAKDLKDIDGDEATGVWTLPVLLGPRAGKAAVAVLLMAGYVAVPVFLPYGLLTVPAIAVGLGSVVLLYGWRSRHLTDVLLAICLAFTTAVALVALTDIEPLLNGPREIERGKARELQGRMAEARNDWDGAGAAFADAAAVFEHDPDIQLRAGATLFEAGHYERAVPLLERAVDLDPASSVALEYLARTEAKLGRIAAADGLLLDGIREGLRPGVLLASLGTHCLATGSPGQAAEAFTHALRLGRPDVPVRIRLGDALMALGRRDGARVEYETAVSRRPSAAEARDALGRYLFAVRENERAVEEITEAVRLEPDDAIYRNNLGAALRVTGRLDESLASLDEAVRLSPMSPEPYYARGLTLEAMGRTEEARRQYLLALELDPTHAPARAAVEQPPAR